MGSAALNACMVASGRADAYYEYGVHCWDIAAAVVIVQEAGGVCIMPTGERGREGGRKLCDGPYVCDMKGRRVCVCVWCVYVCICLYMCV